MHSLNGVSERRAAELNSKALEHFIYQPVSRDMINYLADAARNVIPCDSSYDLPTPPRTPEPADKSLPTLEEFITQLVTSSNVQVPTLMSSLVYLNRLKSRLQPQARGLKCTTHRIFLAALILAAKYLNDSSPKNKHWARYTNMETDWYQFGFNRTEVNLMEKQLLFLLEWKLRITNEDLYAEFEPFLEPLRLNIIDREARKQREAEERYAAAAAAAAASQYSSPAPSREQSRSRRYSPEHARAHSGGSISPPDLVSSSASSYASSIASSRHNSRSATPDESDPDAYSYGSQQGSLYDSPVHVYNELEHGYPAYNNGSQSMLPYEISMEQYQQLQQNDGKKRQRRGVWNRLLGGAVRQ